MTKMKPEDTKAAEITFGIELETVIPTGANISIGNYHSGTTVTGGYTPAGAYVAAPSNLRWNAQRDGSLCDAPSGYVGCEFVSPVLCGNDGVQNLIEFVAFLKSIGAKVTPRCGTHIHVGVRSVLGQASPDETINFLNKLGAVCQRLGLAFYSQTGTNRHSNQFCQPVGEGDKSIIDQAKRERDAFRKLRHLEMYQKYRLLNLRPVAGRGTVEFRAFAGTLNISKLLHHLACCLGACRYAMVVKRAQWGVNTKNWWKNAGNGENALRLLWAVFGWQAASSSSTHSFGLFGKLFSEFETYHETALRLAQKFDTKYPNTVLPDTGTLGTL